MAKKQAVIDSPYEIGQKVRLLLACIAQEHKVESTRLIKQTGLSLQQLSLLHALAATKSGCLTVNQLKGTMIDETPNVSRALNKLVDSGYVIKQRDERDQRVVYITITTSGRKAHHTADEAISDVDLGLSERETQQLFKLLKKL